MCAETLYKPCCGIRQSGQMRQAVAYSDHNDLHCKRGTCLISTAAGMSHSGPLQLGLLC
jgi:hypothetical protein